MNIEKCYEKSCLEDDNESISERVFVDNLVRCYEEDNLKIMINKSDGLK